MNSIATRTLRACSRIGIALTLLGALLAGRAALAQTDQPALWKIGGPQSSVYLFGSFHLLPSDVKWLTPELEKALEESSTIALEVVMGDLAPQTVEAEIGRSGLLPKGQTLLGVLPDTVRAELRAAASELEVPVANLAPMRPWLAALTLSLQFVAKQGFDVRDGVDLQIETWGRENGKQLVGLETAASQLAAFGALSREQDVQFLSATLRQIRETPKMLEAMLAAYRKGDVAALDRMIHFSLETLPQLRDRLFRERHVRWVPQIEKMLASGKTHVIVVGAGHLVGRGSVVEMLRSKGIKVEGP